VLTYRILQILLLRLYARRHRPTVAVDVTANDHPTSSDSTPAAAQLVDPLDGLDDSTKITFQVCYYNNKHLTCSIVVTSSVV